MTEGERSLAQEQCLFDLIDLARNCIDDKVPVQPGEKYRIVMGMFLLRQIEHAKSLYELKQAPDTTIIARTMLEGIFYWAYINEDRNIRSQQWMWYEIICQINRIKMLRGIGIPDDPEFIAELQTTFDAYGKQFIKDKKKSTGDMFTEKFYPNFLAGVQIADAAKLLVKSNSEMENLYDTYKIFCDWTHWSPSSISNASNFSNN